MRRALGELDQNTPIANRLDSTRSPWQCNARARDETPVRTRDAADGEGCTPASLPIVNRAPRSKSVDATRHDARAMNRAMARV
jgi:hypothetical protein